MKLLNSVDCQETGFITPKAYKFMERSLFFSRFLRFHPLEWDRPTQSLGVSTSKKTMAAWGLSMVTIFGYYAFLVVRSIQVMVNGCSTGSSIYMAFMTAFFTFPVLYHTHMSRTWREFQRFVNQYLRFFQLCRGKLHFMTFCIIELVKK